MGRIKRNRAQCKLCKDVIESTHRHDFVECSCGEIFLDGGLDYIRAGAVTDIGNFIDLSEVEKSEGVPAVHYKGEGFTGAGKTKRK